ncbi:S41 family peptidase [Spirosoma sp. RP8]|uniref:S41 family peptidase n=1 Tax=Spirosoma liriopis TaxID=2937440 RepID=A0ABT0HDL2_9BACT|nr:S41 family peptidase [Spirosoma liriopis]MCK8490249.1 S41 family peptidase [Spirosoma liriopis]
MKSIRLVLVLFIASGCSPQLLGPQTANTPVTNFDQLWKEYDQLYGAFEPKKIDWDAAYKTYRPQINEQSTDADLYRVMTSLLDVLGDNHVYLRPTAATKLPWYSGGILGRTKVDDYNGEVVKRYVSATRPITDEFECGKIGPHVGYLLLKGFEASFATYDKTMDSVLTYLADTKGIIIDLRNNGGGEDRVAQYVANRFASERHRSFTARLRNGLRHADFAPELTFYTEPAGLFQYTKPVVVLTNRSSYSSAETFVLAMIQNKQVTQVGDVTGGALSDAITRDLPNGWSIRVPIADVRNATGQNLEGIGIMPKIRVKNTPDDLKAGHDRALERAIELLQ